MMNDDFADSITIEYGRSCHTTSARHRRKAGTPDRHRTTTTTSARHHRKATTTTTSGGLFYLTGRRGRYYLGDGMDDAITPEHAATVAAMNTRLAKLDSLLGGDKLRVYCSARNPDGYVVRKFSASCEVGTTTTLTDEIARMKPTAVSRGMRDRWLLRHTGLGWDEILTLEIEDVRAHIAAQREAKPAKRRETKAAPRRETKAAKRRETKAAPRRETKAAPPSDEKTLNAAEDSLREIKNLLSQIAN